MGIARKFMRSLNKAQVNIPDDSVALACRISRIVAAVGFAMTPFAANAANPGIVKVSGQEYLGDGQNVANIYADSVLNDRFAYNAFNKFNVDAGKIANMYFKTETGNKEASNLLNFVYSRIDVNGTVNAIQNSKIGGNLIFLSKDGMAVGKSGVINAGSLTVMTPTEGYMDQFKLNDSAVLPSEILDASENIAAMNVPINKSGTINIKGKINTTGDIRLKAAQIDVAIYDETTNAAEKGTAILQTGVVEFKDLVNVGGESAGLGNDLRVERSGNGDIVLIAENRYNDNYSATDTFTAADGEAVNAVVNIGKDAQIVAQGDVQIKASATNNVINDDYTSTDVATGTTNGHLFGQIVQTKAEVNIDGQITANRQADDSGGFIDIDAEAKNVYASADTSVLSGASALDIIGTFAANEAIAYAVLENEANIRIKENAVLKATANDIAADTANKTEAKKALSIVAEAGLEAAVGASTTLFSAKNVAITSNIPSAAVTYTETTNKANVEIEGKLISADSVEVKALADSKVDSAALNTTFKLADNPEVINAAVNVVDSENGSNVEIKGSAVIGSTISGDQLAGDLDVVAHSINELISKADVTAADTSIAATAVNITNYDANANVIIDAPLKAESVNVAAINDVNENTVTADNAAGASLIVAKASGALKNTQAFNKVVGEISSTVVDDIANFKHTPQFLKDALKDDSGPTITVLDKIGQLISVGASVGVADVNHNAKVLLTENAVINAEENISIQAKSIINDTLMHAIGATSNYADRLSNQQNAVLLVNASVLYSDIENNASVVVEGGDAHTDNNAKYAQLIGKNVNVNAEARFKYDRVGKMIADLKEMCDKVTDAYDKVASDAGKKEIRDKFAQIKREAETLDAKLAANENYEGTADGFSNTYADIVTFCNLVADLSSLLIGANSAAIAPIVDMAIGAVDVVGAVVKFASPYNYVSFNAGTSAGGRSDDQGAEVSVAGSANINFLANNANVLIGKNSVIDAEEKVNINAFVESKDVVLNGKVGLNSGGNTAVTGGVVGVHFTDANSIVAIAEGVKIDAQQIDIGAANDVLNTAITFGGAKSNGLGVQGMVNYMNGDSNSIVSVDDEATLSAEKLASSDDEKDGLVNIHTENDTTIVAVTGGFALGSTGGVGIALGINEFDRNSFAAIADNDAIVVTSDSDDVDDDVVISLKNIIKEKSGLVNGEDESAYVALFGSESNDVIGQITVDELKVEAKTDGFFTNVAADAGITTGSDENKPGVSDKLDNFLSNQTNRIQNKINNLDNTLTKKILKGDPKVYQTLPTNQEATNPKAGQKLPSFSLTGAGSGAVNTLGGTTAAVIDNANITFNENSAGKLNVNAKDDSMIIAAAGGAAITYKGYTSAQNQSNVTGTLTGSVGVNDIDTDVLALIRNSEIKDAKSIVNNAQRGGTAVAAGLGVGVAAHASGGGNSGNATAAVSVNLVDEKTHAHMIGNIVANDDEIKTAITNIAYNNNLQITGGVNTNINLGGKATVAVGGTVNWAIVDNDVEAKISGGTYDDLSTVDVKAITDMTQINAAVGVGITTVKGANIQANVVYSKLNNQVDATVEDVTMVAEKLIVDAHDEDLGIKKHEAYLKARNFDTDGEEYIESAKDSADIKNISDSGNLIVNAALEIGASADGGSATTAVGASVVVNDLDNDFRATVDKATITLNGNTVNAEDVSDLIVNAESSTLLVSTAVGANGSSKGISGAGSFTWNTLNNDVIATVKNSSDIDAASVDVNADNKVKVINVAGSVGVGGKAIGLAMAYNALNSNTGAYVQNSTIENTDGTTSVDVSAANNSDLYAIGAGVGVSTDILAANGSIGINRGHNDIEAAIADSILSNVKALEVSTNDETNLTAVGGGITAGKGIAIGGAVAYNQIGDFFTSQDAGSESEEDTVLSDNKVQINRAAITGTTINTADDSKVKVSAFDNAHMNTIAVGVGISASGAGVAVQGAAATAILDKITSAEITATSIDTANNKESDVEVSASTNNSYITTADVVSGTQNVAVGAGVTVNQLTTDTRATVSNGIYNVGNMHVKADSVVDITNVGVGAAASGKVSVGGSVAVNQIDNDTTAELGSDDENVATTITATGNVGVTADSYEVLKNYVGQLSIAAGGPVGTGASVAYNEIIGNTKANVKKAVIKVAADDTKAIKVKKRNRNAKDDRNTMTYEQLTGLVVAADSEHKLDNVVVTGSVAAGGSAGVAVSGTVDINSFDGETVATVSESDVNKGVAVSNAGNVAVVANDYTDIFSSGSNGSIGAAGSAGVAVGGAADTNSLNRDVTASIVAKDGTVANRKTVNANKMNVNALNKHFVTTNVNGLSVAVSATGTAGAAAAIDVTEIGANTVAKIDNIESQNNGLKLDAHHYNNTKVIIAAAAVTASVGGGNAGMGIAVLNDNSNTQAIFTNNDIDAYVADGDENSGKVEVLASNHNDLDTTIVGASVAASIGAGAGGTVTVNNMESVVKATVAGSTINFDEDAVTSRTVNDVSVKAENDITTKLNFDQGAGGFIGIAAGVGVNTVDTTVLAEVSDSSIVAKDVSVIALEERDVEQSSLGVAAGGGAFNANILISSVGTAATETYGDSENTYGDDNKKAEVNINEALERANNAKAAQYEHIRENNLLIGNIGKDATLPNAQAKGGGKESAEGVVTKINDSSINASANVTVKADATTDATIHSLQGAVAAAGVINTTVAVLNVDRKNEVRIDDSIIIGADVIIASNQAGTSEIKAVQAGGSAGGAFNVAYSGADISGTNKVSVTNSNLVAADELDLNAVDNTTIDVRTIGATAGAVFAGGALIANTDNISDNEIVISNTGTGNNHFEGETVDIIASKNNTTNVEVIGGAVGAMALNGLVTIARDSGDSRISISGNNTFAGNASISAMSNPVARAKAEAYSGSLIGTGGASVATAEVTGVVETLVNGNNTFAGNNVSISAIASQQTEKDKDGKDVAVENVEAIAIGHSGAIGGTVNANVATAKSTMTVNVDLDSATYNNVNNLTVQGLNGTKLAAKAEGVNVAGHFASGNNVTDTIANLTTTVNARGNSGTLQDAGIKADSFVDVNNQVNGYGGAILIDVSPLAAWAKNNVTGVTTMGISGEWNVNSLDVNSLADNDINIEADAVKAALVGGSGVRVDNSVIHNNKIIVEGATIKAADDVKVKAQNGIGYLNNSWGNGYGALYIAALDANDTVRLSTDVDFIDSDVVSGGSIDIKAVTGREDSFTDTLGAEFNKSISIKSAGVVNGTIAEDDSDIDVVNSVSIDEATTFMTIGESNGESNIDIIANDYIKILDEATADTQGGAVGASSSDLNIDIFHKNTVTINGVIDGNYDVGIAAGEGSVMNVTLKSNAFNKTAAPLVTLPGLDSNIKQENKVIIGNANNVAGEVSTATIKASRNINISATKGDTTLATQSQVWRWVTGGLTGTSSIASTADGTGRDIGSFDNGAEINGTLLAGKNNELEITITNGVGIPVTEVNEAIDQDNDGVISLEEAFVAYGSNLDALLEAAENDLETARINYETKLTENKSTGESQTRYEQLAEAQEKLENNTAMVSVLSAEKDELEIEVTNKSSALDTAKQKAENTWSQLTVEAQNEYWSNLTAEEQNSYESAKDAYVAKETLSEQNAYNDAVDARDAKVSAIEEYDLTNITALINTLQDEITDFEELDDVEALKTAYETAKTTYETAVTNGITAETINNVIFAGKEDKYATITASDWYVNQNGSPATHIGLADYAVHLTQNIADLTEMMQKYDGTDAGTAYAEQLARVQSELAALGLGHVQQVGDKSVFVFAEGESTVPTVMLKDITVSGGDINISSDKLSGTGNITAKGNPSIKINNSSDYYLHLEDVIIDNAGGDVKYNGVALNNDADVDKLVISTSPAKLNSSASIQINGTTSTKAVNSAIYTPDIGIFGEIRNPYGIVTINNVANSVYIAGSTSSFNENTIYNRYDGEQDSGSGSIKAREVTITAGGFVTQGYQDSIVNAGGNPHYAVEDKYVIAIQKALVDKLADKNASGDYYTAFSNVDDLAKFIEKYVVVDNAAVNSDTAHEVAKKLTGQNTNSQNGIYAAGSIYINAANINVNGTIQSGFDTYQLTINDELVSSLKAGNVPANAVTDGQGNYLVTNGEAGAVYNGSKYVYNVRAWYNPGSNVVFTENIDQSSGGRIYLNGAISNTNAVGGKLVALDGGTTIEINSTNSEASVAQDYTLQIGSINAANVSGIISITDTNKKDANGNYVTTVYTSDSESNSYAPLPNQVYQWTTGEASRVITTYKEVYDSSWFGLDKNTWEERVKQLDEVQKQNMATGTVVEDGTQVTRGDVVDVLSAEGNYGTYVDFDYIGSNNDAVDVTNANKSGNLYTIIFERSGQPKQGRDAQGNLLYVDAAGNLTTEATGNNPYYLKDASGEYIYETQISDRVSTRKKKFLGLWGSTVTTTWKETKGMLTAYNFGLKADNSIGISFIGNETGSSVTVKGNASDILLNGDLRADSVSLTNKTGSVRTANFNNEDINRATIYSDNIAVHAGADIEIAQRGVNTYLTLEAISDDGNINVDSMAGMNTGDVYLKSVMADGKISEIDGKAIVENGLVSINVEGNILSSVPQVRSTLLKSNGSVTNIQANGIVLDASGNVGTAENRLLVTSSADKPVDMHSEGDIYLEHVGNEAMFIGEIVSTNGNVDIISDGGFVDGILDNTVTSATDAERLAEWNRLGLLGGESVDERMKNDLATQNANLASQAINIIGANGDSVLTTQGAELVSAVADEYQAFFDAQVEMFAKQTALNDAVSNLGKDNSAVNKSDYDNALSAYNAAYAVYALAENAYKQAKDTWINGYVAAQGYEQGVGDKVVGLLDAYETLNRQAVGDDSEKYGWTQRQLLYAVQDSIINPAPGSISDVKTSNITANNVILHTANGSFGEVVDTQKTVIKIAEMFDESNTAVLSDLQKLVQARADDVTWGNEYITVERTVPISITLNDNENGTITLDAPNAKNVYMIGKDSALNLNQIITSGDVRLLAHEGIQGFGESGPTIIGNNITLEGGYGDIGSALHNVNVGLLDGGKVNANTAGNLYLNQYVEEVALSDAENTGSLIPEGSILNENFVIGSLAAKNIYITASGDIVSGQDKIDANDAGVSEFSNVSHINASESLNLKTSGAVGSEYEGLRIKNSGSQVNIAADGAMYLEAKQDGTLVLGKITDAVGEAINDSLNINSEGSVQLGVSDDEATAVDETAIVNAKEQAISVTAAKDIVFGGKVEADTIMAHSLAGDIRQTATSEEDLLVVNNLTVNAVQGSIILNNVYNQIAKLELGLLGQDLDVNVNQESFVVDLGEVANNAGGNLSVENTKASGTITVETGDGVNVYGNVTIAADGDVTINEGAVIQTNKANGNNDALLADTGDVNIISHSGNVVVNGTIEASATESGSADVVVRANNNAIINATITAGNDVKLDATTAEVNAAVTAGNDVKLDATIAEVNAEVKADNDVSVNVSDSALVNANILAKHNVDIISDNDVTINANATVTAGNEAKLDVVSDANIDGTIDANGVVVQVKDGNVNLGAESELLADEIVSIENVNGDIFGAGGSMVQAGTEESINGTVSVVATNGDIDLYEVLAGNDVSIVANSGNVSLHQINGQVVALTTQGEEATLRVENVVVGSKLEINSNNSAIGNIEQRQGATSALDVDLKASDRNKPMKNVEMNFGKMANGVAFDNLWTNNATISVASGELHLPKLAVLDKATFTVSGYETTVYGTPPVRNDSNSIYWYNVVKNNPADNINAWYDNNAAGNWMNLHFAADGVTQHSNGVLLYLDNYYYVYDQRFTAVDHLNERLARNANEVYVKTFTPDISYYRRYALYDLPKFDYEEAGEEDIIVENI